MGVFCNNRKVAPEKEKTELKIRNYNIILKNLLEYFYMLRKSIVIDAGHLQNDYLKK